MKKEWRIYGFIVHYTLSKTSYRRLCYYHGRSYYFVPIESRYLKATTIVRAIEDGPGGIRHVIVTSFTGTTTANQILAAVKADISAATGMTFQ